MDLTTEKYRSLVRKWQSLIEATVDVKTTDGFYLRMFAIAFTARRPNQIKKTSYAQSSQKRLIRKKMADVMSREATTSSLNELVAKFIPESISNQIIKETQMIFPLTNVFVRRVKILKTPKFDPYKLQELFAEIKEDTGVKVQAGGEAPAAAAPAEETKA
jgi:small subunit ribosomal protein S3Ae